MQPFFSRRTERRIERPVLHLQNVFGRALNVLGDPVAVEWTEQQGSQDQQLESALDDLPIWHGRYTTKMVGKLLSGVDGVHKRSIEPIFL